MAAPVTDALREANKRVVRRWLETLRGDEQAIRESHYVVSPGLRWTLFGTTPLSGTYFGLEEVLSKFQHRCWHGDGRPGGSLQGLDPEYGIKPIEVLEVIALEDARVMVHCRSDAMGRNGLPYRNEYCWIITVEDGLVSRVYEFADTVQIETVMFDKRLVPAELLEAAVR